MKRDRGIHQFVTRPQVERTLDAGGCGPRTARVSADATIEAIYRRTIRGG